MTAQGPHEPTHGALTMAGPEYVADAPDGGAVIVTGVFDLLHVGHVRFLTAVRTRGHPLLVGVEDDRRTQGWKGPGRPLQAAVERAEILLALRAVDGVFLIHGDPEVTDWRSYADLLAPLRPVALAHTAADPHTDAKRRAATALGARAWEFPATPARSTTRIAAALAAGR